MAQSRMVQRKHILECSGINRALDAHKNTLVALYILYLRTFLLDIPHESLSCAEEILLLVKEMQSIDFNVVREAFGVLQTPSTNTGSIIHTQIKHFEAKENNNAEFQFIANYLKGRKNCGRKSRGRKNCEINYCDLAKESQLFLSLFLNFLVLSQ